MKNLAKFLGEACVVLGSFCSFAADTVPEGMTLTDLTSPDTEGTHVTTTATGTWVKPAKNAFDNGTSHNNDDRSICKGTTVDWIYTFDEATLVNAYKVYTPGSWNSGNVYNFNKRMPKNWTFQGKMASDTEWTTLDTRTSETGWTALESRYFQFDNTTAYDSYRFAVTADNAGDGYIQIDELEFFCVAVGGPVLADLTFSGGAGSYAVGGTVTKGAADDAGALAIDGDGAVTKFSAGAVAKDTAFSSEVDLTTHTAYTTYKICAYAENDISAVTNDVGVVYTGVLTVEKVRDADETSTQSAVIRLSRVSADPYPLSVDYTLSSVIATADINYVAPSGVATIPAGASSVDIELVPICTGTMASDATVTFTFATKDNTFATADQVLDVLIVHCPYDLSKRYVDCTVTDGGKRAGTDWADAYANIADAVASVRQAGVPATIYVKAGTYEIASQLVLDNAYAIIGVADDPANVVIENTTAFKDKTASVSNRVVTLNHAAALLANVTVTGGAPNGNGLNILIASNGGTVSNCISKAASLPYYDVSGSVYLSSANALLTHSVIDGVTASAPAAWWDVNGSVFNKRGVGVHVAAGRVENTLVKDAVAGVEIDSKKTTHETRVGGIYVGKGAAAINCTVVNCSGSLAGGIYAAAGATVENCVAADCYTKGIWEVGGAEVDTLNAITAEDGATVLNCATDEATALNDTCVIGTTTTFFMDYAAGDFVPKSGGPLHNTGVAPEGWAKGDGRLDLAGKTRFADGKVDIGAYERNPSGSVIVFR